MDGERAALLISGTVGSGKTTTALAVGERLRAAGVPHAVIDLDRLRRSWPQPPGDRFGHGLELVNLRAVAATYLAAGARRLVLAGVVEEAAGLEEYAEVLGTPVRLCRLRVDLAVVQERLRRRHAVHEPDLRWHLHRSGELEATLDAGPVADAVVDATGLTPAETAAAVLRVVGWVT